ncbi:MAG TPA: alpha/beta hydrolase [Acidimicrobiales bacterium]|nr:alpha/beta hydrolase [Acidimicrobiales bacterium]
MPDSQVREHTISTNGVDLHLVEAGTEGPVVLLAHGFPELAYSWRHQLPALADAGYRVVAPDQRGYGRSSRPDDLEAYDIHHLTGDLVGVLDDLGEERAVVVGHDWGSMVVSHLALLHPERVRALVNMSVPHLPRGGIEPITAMRNAMGDNFFYILYFQEPGVADAELGGDPARTMRRLLAGAALRPEAPPDPGMFAPDGRGFIDRLPEPDGLPAWLTPAELDHYIAEFTRTGFTGGLNWYRNIDRNWATTPQLAEAMVSVPSLFVGGALDPVLVMSPPATGHSALTDHRGDVLVEGAGHWVQQEKPDEVNAALVGFLDDLDRGRS